MHNKWVGERGEKNQEEGGGGVKISIFSGERETEGRIFWNLKIKFICRRGDVSHRSTYKSKRKRSIITKINKC